MLKKGVVYLGDIMQEKGIFLPDGTFESDKHIKRKLAGELPIMETPKKFPRSWTYYSDRFKKRQEQYLETSDVETDHVSIQFKGDTILNFIGDAHIGHSLTHYNRLEQEIETIVDTPNSYVVLLGDIIDGFFFNPAQMEEMEQVPEQYDYMKALVSHLANNRKLLIGFSGQHESWSKKMGLDPFMILSGIGAYYMQGVGHLTAKVDDQEYKITMAHNFPGTSIRDNTWGAKRAGQEIQGADVYINADSHKKGHSTQAIDMFGGESRVTHFVTIGPYKPSDEFARKLGFPQQSPESMYGSAIKLLAKSKEVLYFNDVLKANE